LHAILGQWHGSSYRGEKKVGRSGKRKWHALKKLT
jgi:hypothetical protein